MNGFLRSGIRVQEISARLPEYQGNRILTVYVSLVVAGGLALLAHAHRAPLVSWAFLLWFVFSLVAELLWLETPTGEATDSMASTFNVAVLYLFGAGLSLWIIGLSVLLATRFVQKRDWTRSFFGLGQMVITAFLAGKLFELLGGGTGSLAQFRSLRGIVALVLACGAYYLVNTYLVAVAVSLERRQPLWPIWRTNYGYRNAILSSGALFALSPILLLSYLSLSYPGVVLFFLPLVIVKNQNREYIQLQRTTQALIASERMAAKGEMAASVAHEINNYLSVVSGRWQLVMRKLQKEGRDDLTRDNEIMLTQFDRLRDLARGLQDFSHMGLKVTCFDLNRLCRDCVEFLKPQNAYDDVVIELDLDPEVGEVEGDPGQVQQVLLNFCKNSADALKGAGTSPGEVRIRTRHDRKGVVRVEVEDNGPGVPPTNRQKIFEWGFTTKPTGHGFGLATCYRIAESHHGRIWVEEAPQGGARFVLAWPGWKGSSRAAQAA